MIAVSRVANQKFWAMIQSCHAQGKGSPLMIERTLIGIDPGETTGFAWRYPGDVGFKAYMQQINTKDRNLGADAIAHAIGLVPKANPLIICEDYRVYASKTDAHAWAGLHTAKLIGQIERIAHLMGIPVVYPMASEAKSWAEDQKLKMWDLYEPGMKHARDAERHIITRAFFGKDPI